MTRINANLDPIRLTDQHLMAEYNETAMVYASLRRSRKAQTDKTLLSRIPKEFTLNGGHVLFFYNKLGFLHKRYQSLIVELKNRGYNLDPERIIVAENEFPDYFYGDWEASDRDLSIISERIVQRINMKPLWYKYKRSPIDSEFIDKMYGEYL